jgi:hypothetical protein
VRAVVDHTDGRARRVLAAAGADAELRGLKDLLGLSALLPASDGRLEVAREAAEVLRAARDQVARGVRDDVHRDR